MFEGKVNQIVVKPKIILIKKLINKDKTKLKINKIKVVKLKDIWKF